MVRFEVDTEMMKFIEFLLVLIFFIEVTNECIWSLTYLLYFRELGLLEGVQISLVNLI